LFGRHYASKPNVLKNGNPIANHGTEVINDQQNRLIVLFAKILGKLRLFTKIEIN
jgi:hypothetical protein